MIESGTKAGDPQVRVILSLIRPAGRYLDVGCGCGAVSRVVAEQAAACGADFSDTAVATGQADRSRRGIRHVVVLVPAAAQLVSATAEHCARIGYDMNGVCGNRAVQDRIPAFCRTNGMDCLDLTPALAPLARTAYLEIDGHWTAAGNRIVAEALAEHLRSEGVGTGRNSRFDMPAGIAYGAGIRTHSVVQYTLRGVPARVDDALRKEVRRRGGSLNAVAVEAPTRGAGLHSEPLFHDDLDDLAGTWVEDPAFDRTVQDMDKTVAELRAGFLCGTANRKNESVLIQFPSVHG
jgi:SAM-dependent methyltransferase